MKHIANYVISIITTIVTVVTFVSFLSSKPLKTWTKTHSEVIFYGLIFFFMIAGIALNYLLRERKNYRRLKETTARVMLSEHDRKMFQSFIAILPPDGPAIEWLKENFMAKAFLDEHYRALEAVLRSMRLRSLEFDNSEVEASYDQLHKAVQKFEDITLQYMWQDSDSSWIRVPSEWDDARFGKAINDISEVRLELVERYNNFLFLAHKNGIDQ